MSDYWKKKLDELNQESAKSSSSSSNYWDKRMSELKEAEKKKDEELAPVRTTPVKTTTKKEEDEERSWFSKGAFDDGYQFGDITKTILGTHKDARENLYTGVIGIAEKAIDAGAYAVGGIGGLFGADEFKENTRDFIKKDLINEEKIAKTMDNITGGMVANLILKGNKTDDTSVLGEKSDSLLQSGGQLAGTVGLQAVGVPWFVTTGLTSFGGEVESAFHEDATYGEAGLSAAITAGAEMLTEKISGGISFGGKTLDDALTKNIARNISNKTVRTLSKLGLDMAGEGTEELLSGVMGAIGQKITYADDKELTELFSKEEALESFIGGAVLGGGMGGINAVKSGVNGVDYATGLTENEEKVVNKEYENRLAEEQKNGKKLTKKEKDKIYDAVISDMEKGRISIDTIEEVLGGETYQNYHNTVKNEDSLRETFNQLNQMKQGEMTGEQIDLRNELKEQLKALETQGQRNQLKSQLGEEVMGLAQNSRLMESYNERARKGQAFEADLTQYDEKQKAVIQKAVDSGILNNTNRTHEFVDMVAKISADKGVLFDFANNAMLKESGFAMDGKTVNGFVTKDGVTLNIDSAKSLNSVVGHEITHVLEGTELYTALQSAVVEYAKTKGDYQGRYDSLSELYKDIEGADIDAELTSDLVGDYLFTDSDFINNLSVNHRNVFQKIYDEIKYLCKVATAGSKEARELEKVKRAFEKAYQAQKNTAENSGTKYSLNEYSEQQKRNWANSKRIVIYEDAAQLSQFIQTAISDKTSDKKMYFGSIPSDLAGQIKTDTGLDVENYNLSLGSYEIRKILKDHGDESVEAPRGQRAVVPDDFAHIVDVVLNPESIKLSENSYMGKPVIEFTGENNGKMNVVAVVSDKRLDLFVQTAYVNAKKRNLSTPTGEQAPINTPEASSGTVSNNNIANQEESVKYSLSDSDGRQLSKEQQDYFKDSKVRDENGNLLVMYHGTKNGGFTVFQNKRRPDTEGFYFTKDKKYSYTFEGRKANGQFYPSIKEGVEAGHYNPQRYKVYLDVKNPLVLTADQQDIIEDIGYWENIYKPIKNAGYDGVMMEDMSQVFVFDSNQIKNIDNLKPTADKDIRRSLSDGEAPVYGNYNVYGKDIALETAPETESVQESAPLVSAETTMFPDDLAPMTDDAGRFESLTDADAPLETEAPYYEESDNALEAEDPFEDRDWYEVSNRKVNAYMYDHPEVKPFFQEEAAVMLDELQSTTKGEKWYDDHLFYESGGEEGWGGTKRHTSDSIARMLDEWNMSYADIEKGLRAIIEDHGAENIAAAKKIEFMLNDRLLNGYKSFVGWEPTMDKFGTVPQNQDYINMLAESQIVDAYSKESFDALMAEADRYAPPVEEDIAPVKEMPAVAMKREGNPTLTEKPKNYEAIRPKREKQPRVVRVEEEEPRMLRADSNNGRPGEKQRKWVKTSTESEAVDGKVLPEDLNQDQIHYQPIANKVTLGKANAKLDGMGYESSVAYFNSQFANKSVSLEDVALGERLIQEAIKRGDNKTAGELIQNVSILGTELGQKVQALSIIKRLTPEGQLGMLQKTIERGKTKGDKAFEGVELTQEMIDKILSVYNTDGSYDQMVLNEMVEDVKQQIADQMKVTSTSLRQGHNHRGPEVQ